MLKEIIKKTPLLKIINFLYSLKSKYEQKFVIPSYEVKRSIIQSYSDKFKLDVFVETGTFLGDTVEYFRNKYKQVYSVELSEELAAKATKRFSEAANVRIIQGDSGIVLEKLVTEIDRPTLYWLDGHYSSEFFLGDTYIKTARTEKDTPIVKELEVLLHDTHQHVILIDDARLFSGRGDYPKISAIRKMVDQSPFSFDFFVKKDIVHIIPK
jgi:hypothetical protein